MWVVELEISGDTREFPTKRKAQEWINSVKRFDEENGLEGEIYHIYKEGAYNT